MLRLLPVFALLIVGAATASAAQDLPYGPSQSFAVFRNGEQIGRHTLSFQHSGPNVTVATNIDFAVKLLGITAYRYSHRAQEMWAGDTFQYVASQTDDNGKRFSVKAQRTPGGIQVERTGGQQVLPPDVLPSTHWNIRQVRQQVLLNTQDGSEAKVQVSELGREKIKTLKGWLDATRFRYTGDVAKDQWFDDRGRWVKTTFKASDGSTIEYVLEE